MTDRRGRAHRGLRAGVLLAAAGLAGCASPRTPPPVLRAPPPPPPPPRAEDTAEDGAESGAEDEPTADVLDQGDGPVTFAWLRRARALRFEGLPVLRVETDGGAIDCVHVTGAAGVASRAPGALVVVSALGADPACPEPRARSRVYRLVGATWGVVGATTGAELRLRADGLDAVQWKLVASPDAHDGGPWRRAERAAFPPATPRGVAGGAPGFVPPP